ncbi:hypothetical protein KDL45_02690 [bacterium]|nr:hypothetical protein [bacterium]
MSSVSSSITSSSTVSSSVVSSSVVSSSDVSSSDVSSSDVSSSSSSPGVVVVVVDTTVVVVVAGTVDVVVTDGFTGNVALKTAEGTAKLFSGYLKNAIKSSFFAQLGMLLAKPVIAQVMARTDPRRYNGALFVGLNGVAVKSHGGTDAVGFANAVGVAVDMIARDLNRKIGDQLERIGSATVQVRAVASE